MHLEELVISQEHFEIIQPILLVIKFLGGLPVQYTKQGNHYKLKTSFTYTLYSCILTTSLMVLTLWGIVDDLQKDNVHSIRMREKKDRFVTSCDFAIIIIVILFITVTLPLRMNKFWELLRCFNEVDSIVPLTNHKKIRKTSIVFLTYAYLITISLLIFDIIVWTITTIKRIRDPTSFFKNYLTFYALYLLLVTQEIFFWHVVFFVKIIVGSLEKAEREKCEGNRKIQTSLIDRVTTLTGYQGVIVKAVESINNSSAYGIHLIMLSCLLHLVVTPYFLLTEITKQDMGLSFISLQSVWLLAHIGRLLIIVEPCQQCLDETHKTSLLICELMASQLDPNTKNSLSVFALQMDYCKIRFTSCGFFKIDRSLITSIAGAVTTYLVILFQFNTN